MSKDKVVRLPAPGAGVQDALTEVLRQGARKLIVEAVEAELEDFLAQFAAHRDGQGRQAVVRNGYLPARPIQTGIGEVEVQVPRVRDRTGQGILFHSRIAPRYLRRSRSVEEMLPLLSLKGILRGRFRRGAVGAAGAAGRGAVGGQHQPPEGQLGAGVSALAAARSQGQTVRVLLGRRRVPGGLPGGGAPVPAGDCRC